MMSSSSSPALLTDNAPALAGGVCGEGKVQVRPPLADIPDQLMELQPDDFDEYLDKVMSIALKGEFDEYPQVQMVAALQFLEDFVESLIEEAYYTVDGEVNLQFQEVQEAEQAYRNWWNQLIPKLEGLPLLPGHSRRIDL